MPDGSDSEIGLCYLVRHVRGRRKASVFVLKQRIQARQWVFRYGVAVVGYSISDMLQAAADVLGLKDEDDDNNVRESNGRSRRGFSGRVTPHG